MRRKNTTANIDNWTSRFRGFGPVMKKLAGATLEGVAPGIKGAVTSTTDVMRESRSFIMSSKTQVKQQAKTLATTMVGREAMDTINSAISDLKNGTFSMDKLSDSSYDMADDFTDSMNYDYDDNDPASAALAESKKNTAVLGHAISQGSAATITGMQQMTETLANVQIKATNASAKQLTNVALIGVNQTVSQLMGVNNRLDAINQNIVSLLDFHENNTAIINEQAATYYSQTAEMMNSMGEALSGIKDFIESAKNVKDEKDPEWDEFDFSSGFNMHTYKEMIKKNVKNSMAWTMLEMGKTMFGMTSMMGETPLDMVLPSIMSKIIPKNIRNSLTRTDKMFGQTVNNILYRLGDMADSDDFFKSALGSIFGKKREKATKKLNMGDFKKTAMSWNGIAQQTLVEVIPSYLARIESGINKSELRYYNMDTGRFDSMSNIKKKYEKEYSDTIELGMSSYTSKLSELFEKSGSSEEKVTSAQQQINDLVMAQLRGDAGAKSRHETEKEVFRIQKEAGLSGNALRDAMVEFNDAMNSTLKSVNDTVKNLNTASRHMFNTEGIELDAVVRNANIFSGRKFVGGKALDDLDEDERRELERAEKNSKGFIEKVKNFFSGNMSSSSEGARALSRTARVLDNFTNSQYDYWNGYIFSEDDDGGIRSNQATNVSSNPATSQATVNTSQTQGERRINREVSRTTEAGLTDSLNANRNQIEANANRTARIIHDLENSESPDDDKNSIKAMVLSLHHNFLSPMVNGIFGKNGIIRSFFRDILNNEHVKKIRDKLFDEKDGVFGGVTVWFKDQMKHLNYTFNGEGYTDSKGNVFDEKEDSVFDRIASGYDKVRRLAFTHWFGEDFEENETYKKYLGWTDFKKKREDKRAARLAAKNEEATEGKNDESSEAKIDLQAKYKDSWDKMDSMQQAQLYGGDFDSFVQEEEAKLQDGTQTVSGQLKSLADSVSQISGEVIDKVRSNVDRVIGNMTDEDIKKAQEDQNKTIKDKMKGFLPIGLTGATLGAAVGTFSGSGLVASAFLPGGPISGAIAGIGISMLTRSDKFKDFLFGKEDENGEKAGGLISQKTQKFFKDNAPAIAAGAVVGTLKGALGIGGGGLLGTLFAGPVGGALLGMGLSMVKKSDAFQKMLFGEEDEDGKRIGGLLNKENGKLSKAFEKSGGFVKGGLKGLGIGAMTGLALGKMGFIGSALSVGGPVGMGLMGLGLGIASQTEKFKTLLFGDQEFDKDGNPIGRKKNGLLYKVRNNLVLHVFEPVKDKLQEESAKFGLFLAKHIKKPFQLAFGPLIHSMKDLKDDIAESVRATFEKVGNTITKLFQNTIGKMFNPVIKAMGFVAKHSIRLPFDAMKLSLMPLSGALKLANLVTRKKRWAAKRKEHASILSTPIQLLRGAADKVKEQSEAYDQSEFSGRLGKLNKGLTMVKDFKKGLKDSYASEMEKYEEGKAVEGENAFGYMSAKREAKEAKERFKKFKKDSKTQKKIRDVRMAYAEQFKKGEVSLNDKELEIAKKRLEKAGLDPSWVKNNKDLNDLIYNRDDFYDRFNPNAKKKKDKRSFEEEVREDGVKINETPDQVQDRERQKNFFQFMQDAMSPIRDHFQKKNEEDENADGSTDEAILDTLQNIEQSSEANAVMNTIEQGKETGATDGQLRDAAGSRISSLANDIMDHDRDRQEDEKRDTKEAEESKRAKMGGVSTQELEEERREKRKAKISGMKDNDGDGKERKTVFGGIKDFITGGLGFFGKIFKSKTLWKMALGGIATYGLFGEEINQIFTNTLKPWWTETAWPFLQTKVFPTLGGFFDKAVNFVIEKLPDIATNVTKRVVDNMDVFIGAAWDITKAVFGTLGENIISWLKKKLHLGDDEKKEVQFESKAQAEQWVRSKNISDDLYESIDDTGKVTLSHGIAAEYNDTNPVDTELVGNEGYDGYIGEDGNFHPIGKISTFKGDAASTVASIGRAGFFKSQGVRMIKPTLGDSKAAKAARFVGKGVWKFGKGAMKLAGKVPLIGLPFKVAHGAMAGAEGIYKGTKGAAKGVSKVASFFKNMTQKGASEATESAASKAGEEILKTTAEHVDDAAKNKGVIKTLISRVKDGIIKLKDKVVDLLKKMGAKPDEWGKAIIKFFDNIASKLLKSNNKLLKQIGSTIAEKTAEATARTGASATIVVQIGLSIFDGVDGALSASHLFQVPESEVDFGMRTIASIMNIILGLGPVAYIDILLEVLKMLNIVDLKGMLARWLYSKLGGKNHLEEADKEMDALTAKYNKKFKTNLSKEEFNDKANANKGALGRIGQFGSWSWNKISSLWKSDEDIKKDEDAYQKKYHADKLAEWTKEEEAAYEKYKKRVGSKALDKGDWYTKTEGGIKSIGNGPGPNKISSMQNTLGYGTTMQNDPRWANIPIGKFPNGTTSTMATGGCGPTALSMVANGVNPASVAKYANKKGYIRDGGATADLFTKGAADLGLQAKRENVSSLRESLKSGKQVVISGKSKMNGPYTEAGHIIVASGMDKNGNVKVQDPMRGTRIESFSNLTSGMTNSWSYNKKHAVGYGTAANIVESSSTLSDIKELKGGLSNTKTLVDALINVVKTAKTYVSALDTQVARWFSSSNWVKAIGKFFDKIIDLIKHCPVKKITEIGTKLTEKLAVITGRTAADGTGVLAALLALYDGVDGWTSAASLFGIAKEEVTWEMRVISSVLSIILGIGPVGYLDIVFWVVEMINPEINIKQWIARTLYEFLFGGDKLNVAIDNFEAQVAKYNAINKTNLSVTDWNRKTNSDTGVWGGITKGIAWIGAAVTGDLDEWNDLYDNLQEKYKITDIERRQYDAYKSKGGKLKLSDWYTTIYANDNPNIGYGTKAAKFEYSKDIKKAEVIGFGPKGDISTKTWFEHNGKKYVMDVATNTITYIEVDKKDEGKLQDRKRFLGNSINQLAPQPFLNYMNGVAYESGTPGLEKFGLNKDKNRKVIVKTASGKDLTVTKNDLLKASSGAKNGSAGSAGAGAILGEALSDDSSSTSTSKSSSKDIPDMWTLMREANPFMSPFMSNKTPALPGTIPLSKDASSEEIKKRTDAERKIRTGFLKEKDEYKFNTAKFYQSMNIASLKTMVEIMPSLLKDERIPFFKKIYDEFVVTGDYQDNHHITLKEVESIQGRHKLSETLGGFGTYGGSYEYKNGFPFFQTDDTRWADIPWRGANVKQRGGDLASLAMVASAFGPNVITPDYINQYWLDGRYASWHTDSDGLNQDVIFSDGGFNALRETQVDGKRLTVQKLSNDSSIINSLAAGKPVVITGYKYNGSMFGGYYDKVQKGSDKNPVLSPTQVNVNDPDAYSTLVAVAKEGDYFAVNDPFTTLEQPSIFSTKRIYDKLGNGTKAYKTAYSIAGPNGEKLSLPVNFSNKEGGVSDYESISEAQGLGGKIGAIFNNMKAVFEHMFESLTGGTAYRSIKEVNEIEGAGADDIGVGFNSLGKLMDSVSDESQKAYAVGDAIEKIEQKRYPLRQKNRNKKNPMSYKTAVRKYKFPKRMQKKGQPYYLLYKQLKQNEKYKDQEGTPGYKNYWYFNDQIVSLCRAYAESNRSKITSSAGQSISNVPDGVTIEYEAPSNTGDTRNLGVLNHAPMSGYGLGYGIGTGNWSSLPVVKGTAGTAFSSIINGAMNKPIIHYPISESVSKAPAKTLSGATITNGGTTAVTNTTQQINYATTTSEQKVDISKATWADKMEAIGYATTAQMMGEDYETAKYNYLAQKVGSSSGGEEGTGGVTSGSAAMVNPSDEAGYIWNELIKNNATPQGAAGVMGNFEKESGNHAVRMQGDYKHSDPNKASQDYTNKADQDPASFISDRVGYGLAQWTSAGRKEGLINLAKTRGVSVGDIATQVAWFMQELNTDYKGVHQIITSTNSIADASNAMLHKFEMPSDQSTREENERIGYANAYFEKFANAGNSNNSAQVSYGPGNKFTFKMPKSVGFGRGAIGYGASWINIVQAVKQAIAAQQPGYSQSRSITIDVGGVPKSVRTDCSGFVSACVSYYTGQDFLTNSSGYLSPNIGILQNAGFQYMPWPGWEGLVPGDIIAISGHVEIFAGNEGGTHMVYNCGSDSSTNNPGMTKTSRSAYSSIWRSPEAGSAVLNSTGVGATNTTATGMDGTGTSSGGPVAATGLDIMFAQLNEMGGAFNKSVLGFGPGSSKSESTPEGFFTKSLGGVITSGYGHRSSSLGNEFHRGLDIGAPYGTNIKSPVNGKVVSTGTDAAGYGNYAVVQDEEGVQHLFGHMQNPVGYGPGTQIYKDSVIGQVGSSGKSTGSHLHYEMRKNDNKFSSIDPTNYKYDTKVSQESASTGEIGYGSGNMNTSTTVKEKLTVALNTKNLETKMDTLIDVMRTWAERDEANSKSMTLNNVTNNTEVSYGTGNSKPVTKTITQTSTTPKKNFTKMSLADIHKSIASKK